MHAIGWEAGAVDFCTRFESEPGTVHSYGVMAGHDKLIVGGSLNGRLSICRYFSNGSRDDSFRALPNLSGDLRGLSVSPRGLVYVLGKFTAPVPSGVLRLLPNGDLDPDFHPPLTDAPVTALSETSSGSILIGGGFFSVNSLPRRSLALLGADGALDSGFDAKGSVTGAPGSFGSGDPPEVRCMLAMEDHTVLVGGRFSSYQGSPVPGLMKLRLDGTRDRTFVPSLIARAGEDANRPNTIARLSHGGLLIAGTFVTGNNRSARILRLSPNGAVDFTFHAPGADVQPSSSISTLIDSADRIITLVSEQRAARFSAEGGVDMGFIPSYVRHWVGTDGTRIFAILLDGSIAALFASHEGDDDQPPTILIGTVQHASTDKHVYVTEGFEMTAETRVMGWPPPSLQWLINTIPIPGATNSVYHQLVHQRRHFGTLSLMASNRSGVVTSFVAFLSGPLRDRGVGSIDPSVRFDELPITDIQAMKPAPQGGIYVAGVRLPHPNEPVCDILRLTNGNQIDLEFRFVSSLPLDRIHDIEVLRQGTIVVSGESGGGSVVTQQVVQWVDPTGKTKSILHLGNGPAYRIYQHPDRTVWIVGDFLSVDDASRNRIAVFSEEGVLLERLANVPLPDRAVRCLTFDGEGSIWIGGDFTLLGGSSRGRIARLDAAGTLILATTFGGGFDRTVSDLASPTPDTVWAGGLFRKLDGTNLAEVVRFALDGSVLPMQSHGTFSRFVPDHSGNVWRLGPRAVRLRPDGIFDTNGVLSPGPSGDYFRTLVVEKNGRVYGGNPSSLFHEEWPQSLAAVIDQDQRATGPPQLISSPFANQGRQAVLAVGVEGHELWFSWYADSRFIGESTSLAHFASSSFSLEATYHAVISNVFGSVTSGPVRITDERRRLAVLVQPQRRVAFEGQPLIVAGLRTLVPLGDAFQRQWFKDLSPIPMPDDVIVIPSVRSSDAGCYTFVGVGPSDWSYSSMFLEVAKTQPWNSVLQTTGLNYVTNPDHPWIPASIPDADGGFTEVLFSHLTAAGSNSFGFYFAGSGTLRCRWKHTRSSDSNTLVLRVQGKTTTLSPSADWIAAEFPISTREDLGPPLIEWVHSVREVVAGSSDDASVDWIEFVPTAAGPRMATHPSPASVEEGGTIRLAAVVTSPVSVSYQWFRNGNPVPDANEPYYFAEANQTTEGLYSLMATNLYGTVITSPVEVKVIPSVPRIEVSLNPPSTILLRTYAITSKKWVLERSTAFEEWERVRELRAGRMVQEFNFSLTDFPASFLRLRSDD